MKTNVRDTKSLRVYGERKSVTLRGIYSKRVLDGRKRTACHLYYVHWRVIIYDRAANHGLGSLMIGGSYCKYRRR
jgi:hypothetical protein